MTKTNLVLGLIVLTLGVVAGAIVFAPDLIDRLTSPSKPVSTYVHPPASQTARPPMETSAQAPLEVPPPPAPAQPAEIRPDFSVVGAKQEIKTEDYQDWRVECGKDDTGKITCNMYQRLLWDGDQTVQALMVMVIMAERDGKPIPRMRFIVPLGAILPPGLLLVLEEGKEAAVPFQICTPEGCMINLDMADDVITQLKAKSGLKVGYVRPDGKMARLEVSLKGFTKALERVLNPQ